MADKYTIKLILDANQRDALQRILNERHLIDRDDDVALIQDRLDAGLRDAGRGRAELADTEQEAKP